jgi:hypothetical protein
MVNDSRQRLPELPAGLAKDGQHETANLLHSAAVRLLRVARAADADLDLDGPRASLLSVLVFAGPRPVTKLAELEQVSAPAITKMVSALESAGLASASAQKPTDAWCLYRPLRPEGVCCSGAGQPGYERSPLCLLTQPTSSCRPYARPQTSLRTGSHCATRDWP